MSLNYIKDTYAVRMWVTHITRFTRFTPHLKDSIARFTPPQNGVIQVLSSEGLCLLRTGR